MEITHLNPATLFTSPYFSQGISISGDVDTVHVGGQNGTDASGAIVDGGIGPQSAQAMRNVLDVLAEVGADQSNVIRLGIYLVQGSTGEQALAGSADVWGNHPTTVTVLTVAGLGRPDALVEVEATAVVPRRSAGASADSER